MNKLYTIIALDALENPIDRIEVYAGDIGKAHLTALKVWKEKLPEVMWIKPSDEDCGLVCRLPAAVIH
jgi:hypothetical protein